MKTLLLLFLVAVGLSLHAQVAVNTDGSAPDNSAMLDIKSTVKGLLVPRMTMAQRDAVVSPANGLMVYQTDNIPGYYYNAGTTSVTDWKLIGNSTLALPFSGTATSVNTIFEIMNGGSGDGIKGSTLSATGKGIYGVSSSLTGTNYGVYGTSASENGRGVFGEGLSATGATVGVYGVANSSAGYGVYGSALAATGQNYGVFGHSTSSSGRGVSGTANALTGPTRGVEGSVMSSSGMALYGHASSETGTTYGVHATSNSSTGYGVFGRSPFTGLRGEASAGTGESYGVYGVSISSSGSGVYGEGKTAFRGVTAAELGYGVYVSCTHATGVTRGIYSIVSSPNGYSGYFGGGKFMVNSKVGIGTVSPQAPLEVQSDGASSDVLDINNSTNYLCRIRHNSNGSGGLYLYDGSNTNTIFLYGDGNSFINSDNLGVGTNAPLYKLDVAGTLNLNKGIASGVALRCNAAEALWYNGTYFSWGYGGTYNFYGDEIKIGGDGNIAPAFRLEVNGTAGKTGGGSWSSTSDRRLKDLHGNYNKGLSEILSLQPVRFTYKVNNPRHLPSNTREIGFVAQEVQKTFPEAVSEGKDGYLDFNMHAINVALVNAVKELKAENDRLKAQNEQLQARMEKLENTVNQLAGR